MSGKAILLLVLAPLASASLAGPCFAGPISFNFQYVLYDGTDQVMAAGTLDATDNGDGTYLITGISGTRTFTTNGQSTLQPITSLLPHEGFADNSNILNYPNPPFLDGSGFSYMVFDRSPVNVYFDDLSYGEFWNFPGTAYDTAPWTGTEVAGGISERAAGAFQLSPRGAGAPEPATFGLLVVGSAALFARAGKRRHN